MSNPRVRKIADRDPGARRRTARATGSRTPGLGFRHRDGRPRLTGDPLREAKRLLHRVRRMGEQARRASTAAALESARGLIRSEVGKALGLRHSPSVGVLSWTHVPETAGQIEDLLAKAREADAEVAKAARVGCQAEGRRRGPVQARARKTTTRTPGLSAAVTGIDTMSRTAPRHR